MATHRESPEGNEWEQIEKTATINITLKLKYLIDLLPLVKRLPSHDWCGIIFETICPEDEPARRRIKFVQTSENKSGERVMITMWEESLYKISQWKDSKTGAYFFMTDVLKKCANNTPNTLVQLLCFESESSEIDGITLKFPNTSGQLSIFHFRVPSLEQTLNGKFTTRCCDVYVTGISTPKKFHNVIQQQVDSYKICSSVRKRKETAMLYGDVSVLSLSVITFPRGDRRANNYQTLTNGVFSTCETSYLEESIVPLYVYGQRENVFDTVESVYPLSFKISFLGDSMAELTKKLGPMGFVDLEFTCGFAFLRANQRETGDPEDPETKAEKAPDVEPAVIKLKSHINDIDGIPIVKITGLFELQELETDYASNMMSHIISEDEIKEKFMPYIAGDSTCFDASSLYIPSTQTPIKNTHKLEESEHSIELSNNTEETDSVEIPVPQKKLKKPKKSLPPSLPKFLKKRPSSESAKEPPKKKTPKPKPPAIIKKNHRIVFNDSSVDSEIE